MLNKIFCPEQIPAISGITTLVYKFCHTGFPRYFALYLSSYNSCYSTRRSQSGGNFLVI